MKNSKIKEMSSPELEKELAALKQELFKLRFSLATNGLENPLKIKMVKKDIARIKTILTERAKSHQGDNLSVRITDATAKKKGGN